MSTIRIGTRTSALAMRQTEMIAEMIRAAAPDTVVELVPMKTRGDRILNQSLAQFGGKGAFVTEFEEALLTGCIDLAVHSAKDLPAKLADGLYICCTPKREDPRDVLVTRKAAPIQKETPLVIGTSSPRRAEQIKALYGAQVKLLRGNVPTRLERLKNGEYDGILLAVAGLKRLNLMEDESLSYQILSEKEMVPAAGQGIIAVEGRLGDQTAKLAEQLSDLTTAKEFETERLMLTDLGAGCHEAVGAFSRIEGECISIDLMVMEQGQVRKTGITGPVEERLALARTLLRKKNVME
jgi:hydroxymethylbilane synthase